MANGRSISTGIGQGEAQVFEQPDFGKRIAEIGAAKKKDREEKDKSIYGGIPGLKEPDIFIKHQPYFAQKNKEVWDFAYENINALRKGDPAKTIQFNQMKFDLASDAGLSKQIKDSYLKVGNELSQNAEQYDDDAFDYYEKYSGLSPDGKFELLDPSRFSKRVNLLEDVQGMKSKLNVSQQRGFSKDPTTGDVVSYETETFTPKQAQELLTTNLQNPNIARQVKRDFAKLPDTEKTKYTNEADWYVKTFSPNLVKRDVKQSLSSQGDGFGYTDETIKMAYNTPTTTNYRSGTATSKGQIPFKKPIAAQITLSDDIVDVNGKPVQSKGVSEVQFGNVQAMPTLKVATKGYNKNIPLSDKEVQEIKDLAKRQGKPLSAFMEYKNYLPTITGTVNDKGESKDIAVFYPADRAKNTLMQNGIPYDKFEAEAKRLTEAEFGGTAAPTQPKKADELRKKYNY
jgi:hypothetical protein